jgi:hypothetical protein
VNRSPSVPPPKPSEARSLRGSTLPRGLLRSPRRYDARRRAAEALDRACVTHGVGSRTLAEALGLRSDREASEARSGALPITAGELVSLAPLEVALDVVIELLLDRLARERITVGDSVELRMAAIHVDALRALLLTPPERPLADVG